MPYDPLKHNRRTIRLPGFDYSQPATYFITICTNNKQCLFGNIKDGETHLNPGGHLVVNTWNNLNKEFSEVIIDTFIIMPNHLHAILAVRPSEQTNVELQSVEFPYIDPFVISESTETTNTSLPNIIRYFKSTTTRLYAKEVQAGNLPRFDGKLWQRSYHDRIIRNEEEHHHYRDYIETNPIRWNQ